MKMTSNTILMAGRSYGIGHRLAVRFHQAGNKVIVGGRRQHELDEIVAAQPGIGANY